MPTEPNSLKGLQEAIVDRLKTDVDLSDLEIIAEDRHDLASSIETALAQLGICIIVQTVDVGVSNPNTPGPIFDSVQFSVEVTENVLLNRSPGSAQRDALSIAIAIAERLHHFRPTDVAVFGGMMVYAAPQTIQYRQDDALLAYNVNFKIGV